MAVGKSKATLPDRNSYKLIIRIPHTKLSDWSVAASGGKQGSYLLGHP